MMVVHAAFPIADFTPRQDHQSAIAQVDSSPTSDAVIELFEKILAQIGADYHCIVCLPRPGERIEDLCMSWTAPAEFRALYSSKNSFHRDPVVRHSARTIFPFLWESAPYDPETEPDMKEVMERAYDFNLEKGIVVPVPSVRGMIGGVWMAGTGFEDREVHLPFLHALSLHVFHRLEHLLDRGVRKAVRLTGREREVLAWGSEGKTAWEIGCILGISQRTVEWHFREACQKLGARNRLQAIAMLGRHA